ncbi:MAG: HAMP domain-containing histidine kinase [Anaerolineae bacterium]|nr:HAMP domain-containing histidine kinase [Anaerolineae bacterium]MCO5188055.1 HAMP domain-containing histidine kinase [Anaerolineae bacterium]MCO5192097.1 HAMP domain-containing histidine kinase [Anaerolineae bacterium]
MLRSVRWRLILNSIVISLAAILAVGLVSLALVSAYFEQQERDYLEAQASVFMPSVTQALRHNNNRDLNQVLAIASLLNQVRIRVIDQNGAVVADSGSRSALTYFDESMLQSPELFFGFVMGQGGRITDFSPFLTESDASADHSAQEALTSTSDTTLEVALLRGDQNVGHVEFSEGPAVGEGTIRSIQLALLGSSLIALLLAIVIGMLSARQVTRPLTALGAAADRMGSNDLTARAPGSKLAEYDQLATQFNRMADQLGGTIERLEAERAILRRMIADASHELRTPLTALRTFNELLADEVSAESDAATFVHESNAQINQLEQMTTSMLDLSRLEARLSGTDFVVVDVRRAVDQAVQTLRPLADEKGQTLTLLLPTAAVAYPHDPTALQQAISNLLHNAIKYSGDGGHIAVAMRKDDRGIHIAIQDDGDGIAAADQPYIFNRFYRSPQQAAGGTGLGLSIAREIVAIHGGEIAFTTAPDVGTTFTISLPPVAQ